MKHILRRRPSPALVVACLALFVASGGVSYGVATGSIDSREIKDGSIRNRDFKDGTLRGNEAKRNGFGGGAIKESTLGKVPSAEEADSAAAIAGVTARRFEAFTLDNGQNKGLGTIGPFTLTARCRTEGPNQIADIAIQTSQNGSAVDGPQKDPQFNAGETSVLVAAQAPVGTSSFDQEAAGAAIAPDGTEILGQELYAATNVLSQLGKCRYGGIVYAG